MPRAPTVGDRLPHNVLDEGYVGGFRNKLKLAAVAGYYEDAVAGMTVDQELMEPQIKHLEAKCNLHYSNHYGIMVHTGEDAGGPWEYYVRMTMDQFSKNVLYRKHSEQGDPTVWRQRLQNAAKYDSWLRRISTGVCSGYRDIDSAHEELPDSPSTDIDWFRDPAHMGPHVPSKYHTVGMVGSLHGLHRRGWVRCMVSTVEGL